jgi:hypothetical protein
MPLVLLLVLSLTGCASQVAVLERDLNAYALSAALGSDLSEHLTGVALISAKQSARVIESAGLTSYGSAQFSETSKIAENLYQSCLDVAGTQFRNALGEAVVFERLERQLVQIRFEGGRIWSLELTGAPC